MTPQRFLVTTSRSVLVLDVQSRRLDRIHAGAGLYYGIDVCADRIQVAARRRMVSSDVAAHAESGLVLVFDHLLRELTPIAAGFALRDMHQIRTLAGKLYVTCSFDNLIAVFDGQNWRRWFPLGEPQTQPPDINHFNTVELVDGSLCVVAHNKGASEVLLFDRETLQLQERFHLGVQAHNVWKSGEEWCVCSSAEGKLVGTRGFEVVTGGFPRGIWIGEDYALVGISELAERQNRDFTSSEIIIYDSAWWECERIRLPNEGLVLDIAPLSR
jgi:hypothetical protein